MSAWEREAVLAFLDDQGAMLDAEPWRTDAVVYYRGLSEAAIRAVDARWPGMVVWGSWNDCPGLAAMIEAIAPTLAARDGSVLYHGYVVFDRSDRRLTVEGFHYEGSAEGGRALKDRFRDADECDLSADGTRLRTWWD